MCRNNPIKLKLVITGCDKEAAIATLKMVEVEECVFPARDMNSVNPSSIRLIETDASCLLLAYKHIPKRLQFIDMESGIIEKEVPLRFEGPNSVQRIIGATLTAMDSKRVLLSRPSLLALLNFEGEIMLEKEVVYNLRTYPISYPFVYSGAPLIQYQTTVFGPQPLMEGHHQLNKADLTNYQLLYSFDSVKMTKNGTMFFIRRIIGKGGRNSQISHEPVLEMSFVSHRPMIMKSKC